MATEYRLSHTAAQIDEKLKKIDNLAAKNDLPTKTSDLINDSGFTTENYVDNYAQPKGDYALKNDIPVVPTNVSAFNNDAGYLTEHQSLDGYATELYVDNKIDAIPTPDVSGQIDTHNTSTDAHNDIRLLVEGLTTRLNALADSDDTTLDQMSEIVAYIKSNKTLIEQVTTNKVNVSDIINNLTTNVSNKPLSAAQGVAIKALIDAIPSWAKAANKPSYTKSEVGLGNVDNTSDANKPVSTAQATAIADAKKAGTDAQTNLTTHTSNKSNPHGVTKAQVGLSNVDNVKQYSANNPPPYPVTSVNGQTGAVTVSVPTVPTKVSAFTNDAGYLTQHQDISGKADNVYETVTPEILESVTGKLPTATSSSGSVKFQSIESGTHVKLEVSKFAKIKASGYQWVVSYGYYMIIFANMEGKVVARHNTTDSTFATMEVDVPAGAVYAYVTGLSGKDITVEATKRIDISFLNEEKANRVAKWQVISGELKTGYLVYGDTGKSEGSQVNGEYRTCDVTGLKKVRILGNQFSIQYKYAVCYFYDVYGNYIEKFYGPKDNTELSVELDVPKNAAILKVNGNSYSKGTEVVGYHVIDVDSILDILKPTGKKLITLGDSITALGTGRTGWVKYFLEKTDCELIVNVAVNGAWLRDKTGTIYDGNPVFNGSDSNVNNVLGNQVQKIINNNYPEPDIIMIAIGTNDGISITKDQIKAAYYDSSNELIPLENVDRKTSAGAYRWCLEKLHEKYPNALIFWCTPILGHQSVRKAEDIMAYAESLRIATEFTGQMIIDTIRCGINGANELSNANGQCLVDGLHPNENGAKKIGYYNASKVIPFLGNNFTIE